MSLHTIFEFNRLNKTFSTFLGYMAELDPRVFSSIALSLVLFSKESSLPVSQMFLMAI